MKCVDISEVTRSRFKKFCAAVLKLIYFSLHLYPLLASVLYRHFCLNIIGPSGVSNGSVADVLGLNGAQLVLITNRKWHTPLQMT